MAPVLAFNEPKKENKYSKVHARFFFLPMAILYHIFYFVVAHAIYSVSDMYLPSTYEMSGLSWKLHFISYVYVWDLFVYRIIEPIKTWFIGVYKPRTIQ